MLPTITTTSSGSQRSIVLSRTKDFIDKIYPMNPDSKPKLQLATSSGVDRNFDAPLARQGFFTNVAV
jgi:hypothetical protein